MDRLGGKFQLCTCCWLSDLLWNKINEYMMWYSFICAFFTIISCKQIASKRIWTTFIWHLLMCLTKNGFDESLLAFSVELSDPLFLLNVDDISISIWWKSSRKFNWNERSFTSTKVFLLLQTTSNQLSLSVLAVFNVYKIAKTLRRRQLQECREERQHDVLHFHICSLSILFKLQSPLGNLWSVDER